MSDAHYFWVRCRQRSIYLYCIKSDNNFLKLLLWFLPSCKSIKFAFSLLPFYHFIVIAGLVAMSKPLQLLSLFSFYWSGRGCSLVGQLLSDLRGDYPAQTVFLSFFFLDPVMLQQSRWSQTNNRTHTQNYCPSYFIFPPSFHIFLCRNVEKILLHSYIFVGFIICIMSRWSSSES